MMPTSHLARFRFVCFTAAALSVCLTRPGHGQEAEPSPLDGAWRLVEQKNGDAQEYQKQAEGTEMTKYVTGGRFIWTIVQNGKLVSALGGKYKVDKDKYSETIDYYAGEGQESLVGKTFGFTWKLDGKNWLHAGTIQVNGQDVKIDEKWERCSK
jgi:hypothetical protein